MVQLTLEVSRGVAHWGQQQVRHVKTVLPSHSRTAADATHPSTGTQLKREESKDVKTSLR